MSRRYATVLALLAAVFCLAAPVAAQQQEGRPLPWPPALFGAREAGQGGDVSGELLGRAALRKVKYARVLWQRELPLGKPMPVTEDDVEVMTFDQAEVADLGQANEARLDYLGSDPNRPGCMAFWALVSGKGGERRLAGDPLETVDRLPPAWVDGAQRDAVDVAGASWVSKGLRYQISRLLDREPDDLWRTSQDGLSSFVQRRFRKDITDVGAVDVVLLRGQDVQVNLVVSLNPDGSGRTVLDWYAIPKRLYDLGDGRTVLRLYLGRHLRTLAPGARKVTLKELALMFFKENLEDVAQKRNVEKILFAPSGLDPAWTVQGGLPGLLPSRAREVFEGRGELAANLGQLSEALSGGAELAGFGLVRSPLDPGQPFSQTLEAARLAKVAPRRDVPAILAATAERCQSFGAACDMDDPAGFASQSPLWSLDFQALGGGDRAVTPVLADGLFPAAAGLGFSAAPDGLLVECRDGSARLETGAAFVPKPGVRYSFWLELGRVRRGLSSVEAEAYGGGQSVRVPVKPGFPAEFPSLPPKVEGVRLLLTGHGQDAAFTLRRAALQAFDPSAPRAGLFQARYLFDEAQEPRMQAGSDGALTLLASGKPFAAQWLVLDVDVPPWSVADAPPRLSLSVAGRSANAALRSPSGRVAFFLPSLFGTPGAQWPSMRLAFSGGAPGGAWRCERAVLSGQRLAAWPEVLGMQPLADIGGTPRSLVGLDAAQAEAMAASSVWLPMGRADVAPGSGPVRFLKNPWLESEALLLADASGPELSTFAQQPEAASSAAPRGGAAKRRAWLYALAALPAAGLAWLGLRAGRGARLLSGVRGWLEGPRCGNACVLPWLLAAVLALCAAAFGGARMALYAAMAGSLLAVPLWRAGRPVLSVKWPRAAARLAKTARLHYCSGFLAAAGLAALARLAGAAPVSELLGLCGLWLFCAALLSPHDPSPTSPESTP